MSTPDTVRANDLWARVQSTRFVLITTVSDQGALDTRPMTIQRIYQPGTLLFFGSLVSPLVQHITARPDINVGVAAPEDDFFVSIAGRANISKNRELIEELWSPLSNAWFPGAVDDDDLVLIEVIAAHAEYWNAKESQPVQFFKMVEPAFSGRRRDKGKHEMNHVSDRAL